MVVDDVEDDRQAERVRAVDERAEVVGRAVQTRRRKREHAVVSPAESTGKLGDRHDLEDRDPGARQARQLLGGARQVPSRVKVPTWSS